MDNGPYGGPYGGGQIKRGRMVMLQFNGEHCHVTEVASFNGERMVILRRWPVLMEREWSFYGGGQF